MKYHTATVKHNPPYSYGDCFRASLACVLNYDNVADVPHFFDGDPELPECWQIVDKWLKNEHKLACFFVHFPSECSFDDVCGSVSNTNPGITFMLFGNTASNTDHVVVCRDHKQIHNVSWFGGTLIGPSSNGFWTVLVLVPLVLTEL